MILKDFDKETYAKILNISISIALLGFMIAVLILSIKLSKAEDRIKELESQIETNKNEYQTNLDFANLQIDKLNEDMNTLISVNEEKVELGKQAIYNEFVGYIQDNTTNGYTSVEDVCEELYKEEYKAAEYEKKLEEMDTINHDLVDRLKVYEEYEYCFFDTEKKRNDLTYEDIKLLEQLLENEYVNDVDLYLAWIMIESEGYAKCKNSHSTAKGLAQFLNGTSKSVYSKLDFEESWYPEIVYDKNICLTMMVRYVNDLMDDYKGNLHKTINSYRGLYDAPYLRKFNQYLAIKGKSIDSIADTVLVRYQEMINK